MEQFGHVVRAVPLIVAKREANRPMHRTAFGLSADERRSVERSAVVALGLMRMTPTDADSVAKA